jgi:oxygen-independent coproporphyrinogen-3 oxidase
MTGVYAHIPFCSAICNYCNFNRGLLDAGLKTRYVEALIADIQRTERIPADTIYFGGGTPSLLDPDEVARLIDACRRTLDLARDRARLAGFRTAGVNRLSYGVQSFRESELRRLSRLHTADRARAAVAEARTAGFDNISLDLMMWLPDQRVEQWLESVDAAIAIGPEHLSLYMLEVYPNAPLRDAMARGAWSQASDEDAAAMYEAAMERLEQAGYEQYEISNVARPGRRSRHNLKYWTDGEWLAFGCGAHGTRGGTRVKNVAGTEEYIARIQSGRSPIVDVHRMDAEERLGDALFTGLRVTDGVNLDGIRERYGVDVWRRYGADLRPFVDTGLLRHENSRLALTRRGMLLAHEVMAVFV